MAGGREEPAAGALDDRARRELRSYRRRGWAWLVGGAVCFVAFAVAAATLDARETELERTGVRVPGIVAEVRQLRFPPNGSIVVGFAWEGRPRREVIDLDSNSPAFEKGQRTTVIVDRRDPGRVSLPGESNEPAFIVWPLVAALIGGVGMLVLGPWMLSRARRQRLLLGRSGWRRVPCAYVEIPAGNSVRGVLLLDEADGGTILTLVSLARWRLGRAGLRGAAAVDVAGWAPGYVVVRAPGREPLVSARPPWTSGAARRWRRAVDRSR